MPFAKAICALFTLLLITTITQASTILLEDPNSRFPTILGVEDLEVGDLTYDVYFGRGEYNTLYLGVGPELRISADRGAFERDIDPTIFEDTPYIFPTLDQAEDAWVTLRDTAFNGSLFDIRPQLTNSCGIPASCNVYTPYGDVGDRLDGRVNVIFFANFFGESPSDSISIGTVNPAFRTGNDSAYAVWFLQGQVGTGPIEPAPVPLPSSVIAFLSGLFVFLNLSKSFTGRR